MTKTNGLFLTSVVSRIAVAATAAVCARVEGQSAWRPINGISHILWGDHAAVRRRLTWRYTGAGLVLNGVACGFWAGLYQCRPRSRHSPESFTEDLVSGIATAALAYVTDYHLVPRRFTPGFELTLPRRSFPWLYGALAVGLIAPNILIAAPKEKSGVVRG